MNIKFLTQYITHPRATGAILPSSKGLSRNMVKDIDFNNCNCIVELGAGTGVFTKEILNSHDIKLNYNDIEINTLLEQIVGEYIPAFERVGLRLEKYIDDEDIFINVDVEKIVRVLENLLTNALKYSVENSKVIIRSFKEENNVAILFENKTKDVSKSDLEHIFERFYKIDKSRKDSNSSGLGLNIVKRIVKLHKGLITVELNDEFITFKITLPLELKSVEN